MAGGRVTEPRVKVEGRGSFTPPPGLTLEDCERLAREADAERAAEREEH